MMKLLSLLFVLISGTAMAANYSSSTFQNLTILGNQTGGAAAPGTTFTNDTLVNPTLNGGAATGTDLSAANVTSGSVTNSVAAWFGLTRLIVNSNAALKATSGGYSKVDRAGFATPGDGGAATYTWSATACSISGGDNGSQVAPTTGAGCWIANFAGTQPTPMVWGAVGDGVTNDSVAVQAALTAGGTISVGTHLYNVTSLTAANPVTILGSNGNGGVYAPSCTSGFVAGASNITLLALGGSGSKVEDTCFNMGASGANTTGAAVFAGGTNSVTLQNNLVIHPFIGFDVSGIFGGANGGQNTATTLETNVVIQPSPGGAAFRLGAYSQGGNTVDTRIRNNNVECFTTTTARGYLFLDAGGPMFIGNDSFGCGTGTAMLPGANQAVVNGFFYDVLGDTDSVYDLFIDAANVTAGTVQRLHFINTWTSSAGITTALIQNTNAGVLQDISFVGHSTNFQNGASVIGIDIEAGNYISVQDSSTCGLVTSGSTAIKIGAAARYVDVTGNKVAPCGGTVATGVQVVSGANIFQISGNDLATTTTPISYTPANETAIIANNMGHDNVIPTVASASSVALPSNPTIYISGTTAISTISGAWSNRHVRLISFSGSITYNAGSGICTALTVPQYQAANFTWSAGFNCWVNG